jgi:branched-chain amino acid transport system ATP-binding protein
MKNVFELKQITHSFSDEKKILQDFSLSLDQGNIYAFMGSNGAGKTTLFNIISGFIKQKNGEIFFGKKNLAYTQAYQRNRLGIGRTFQDLRIITKLTVKENIILSMKENPTDNILNALLSQSVHRSVSKQLEQQTDKIIEQFFLVEVQHSMAGEISYGEQKLLSLACCVANGATLLLLDEPVAGIQPEYRNKIAILIRQMKEQGKTFLLIEHNTDFISDVADKIFFLHDGKISDFANIESLRADKTVAEDYI